MIPNNGDKNDDTESSDSGESSSLDSGVNNTDTVKPKPEDGLGEWKSDPDPERKLEKELAGPGAHGIANGWTGRLFRFRGRPPKRKK